MMALKDIRDEKGLTQKDIEELTGIKQQDISRLENGANIKYNKLILLAEKLNVTIDEIIRKKKD